MWKSGKERRSLRCGSCNKTDGLCYTSNPPMVKCKITGNFKFYDDVCEIGVGDIDVGDDLDNIKNLTLENIKLLCTSRKKYYADKACERCPMHNKICVSSWAKSPDAWDIGSVITFSAEEVNLIKNLKKAFPDAEYIERVRDSKVLGLSNNQSGWICDINPNIFTQIPDGLSIKISEIIKDYV